ncbi:MAG TPA: hypothetical protein VG649_04420 [Candidatus Angelobacter sp.]|nr:hypothetical protein [Candidatus Angelobacter sp.]
MSQLTWRSLGTYAIPERPHLLWTPVIDYLSPGKLYKIRVEPASNTDQTWTPEAGAACTADGDPKLARKEGALPLSGVNAGALIARIGGSTADLVSDKDKTVVFAVGRHYVFQAPENIKTGALFLGINDTAQAGVGLVGTLTVTVYDAL